MTEETPPTKYQATVTPKCFAEQDGGHDAEGKPVKVKLGYSGTVTMRIPSWDDRRDILESFGINTAEAIKDVASDQSAFPRMTRHLAKRVSQYVIAVAIKRDDDGASISSWDDVRHEAGLANALITEMSWWLINGKHRLANPSSPS